MISMHDYKTKSSALVFEPGEELVVLEKNNQIILVPLLDMKTLRGALKGISLEGLREET